MHKITPCLWFDNQAEEAMRFYASIFKNFEVGSTLRAGEDGPVTFVTFRLAGQEFMALNGGPYFKFTEAVSFFVSCETQAEVDDLWDKLSAGGEQGQCGWLKDKYGLSWQIVPTALGEMLQDKDAARAKRVTEAMLKMTKLDIGLLRQAYEQA